MRRVVTGLDDAGKSCIMIDAPLPLRGAPAIAWRTAAAPADNSGRQDTAGPFDLAIFADGGTTFMLVEVPPGYPPHMHATDTIDYMIVLQGELVMELEAEAVRMGPGTFIVDRGVQHSWRNDGPETVLLASVIIPAHPVGNGRET